MYSNKGGGPSKERRECFPSCVATQVGCGNGRGTAYFIILVVCSQTNVAFSLYVALYVGRPHVLNMWAPATGTHGRHGTRDGWGWIPRVPGCKK